MKKTVMSNFLHYMSTEYSSIDEFDKAEARLAYQLATFLQNEYVNHSLWGLGTIVSVTKAPTKVEHIVMEINFPVGHKRIALTAMLPKTKLFATISCAKEESASICDIAFAKYEALSEARATFERVQKEQAVEAEKAAQAEAKALANYEKHKASSIAAFDKMTTRESDIQQSEDFWYALGWLASHVGSVCAVVPDYLEQSFHAVFGADTPVSVVDSKKKTSGGHFMQWSWSFKATLRKAEDIPTFLHKYIGETKKTVSDTAFIWDLVKEHGFQFGPKQNKTAIAKLVPEQFKDSYVKGLNS